MDHRRLLYDKPILDKLSNVLPCRCDLVGWRPVSHDGATKQLMSNQSPTPTDQVIVFPYASAGIESSAREFAIRISVTSLGSSQTLRTPHLSTDAASRFCSFNDTMAALALSRGELS